MSSCFCGSARFLKLFLVTAVLGATLPVWAHAQTDRRSWATPGLILETGARHGTCDMLLFTPDGSELLASGDDKVVRIWGVDKQKFSNRNDPGWRTLRWPI